MGRLDKAVRDIETFKQGGLATRIAKTEQTLSHADGKMCARFLSSVGILPSLLESALEIKRASSQINEVVHAVGILVTLPYILEDGEVIQSLSLAAGNTGKRFDLETNRRVAEFKFIDWKGGSESIRQNQLFKDLYALAESETAKERYLYLVGLDHPMKFLTGGRALSSVLSKEVKLSSAFQAKYGDRFQRVCDYYHFCRQSVKIVDLRLVVPLFASDLA